MENDSSKSKSLKVFGLKYSYVSKVNLIAKIYLSIKVNVTDQIYLSIKSQSIHHF